MKIFADYHHAGAARGQVLQLQYRLGHDLYFPDIEFVKHCGLPPGVIMPMMPAWLDRMGGVPGDMLVSGTKWTNLVSMEEFMDTDWDVWMTTRIETQEMFKCLKKSHRCGGKVKILAMTGNDGAVFEWDWVNNFMSSDLAAYMRAPDWVHKIHYCQEVGCHYGKEYVDLNEESLKVVNCFINCWPSFTGFQWDKDYTAWGGSCPHCGLAVVNPGPHVSPYGIWCGARDAMPSHTFREFGIGCGCGVVEECRLPYEYISGAVTVHMKTYDGYGFSLLQSIACGRLVIVPYGFHRYRTVGRYLIPNVTCLEIPWDAKELVSAISYLTASVERANEYSRACYRAAAGLLNWEHEAYRLREFMEALI